MKAVNFECQRCGSLFKYKIRCPYCGGYAERIRPLPAIPSPEAVVRRCVEVEKVEVGG